MPEEVIRNELLCFVFNKLPLMKTPSIQLLCVNTYDDQAIEEAKAILKDHCEKNDAFGTFRYTDRKGTEKKLRNMEDILKMAHLLGEKAPCFVAKDLSNLPPVSSDNIDICSLLAKLERMETELKLTKELCLKVSNIQNIRSASEAVSVNSDANNGQVQSEKPPTSTKAKKNTKSTVKNTKAQPRNPATEQQDVNVIPPISQPNGKTVPSYADKARQNAHPRRKIAPVKGTLKTDSSVASVRTLSIFTKYWRPSVNKEDVVRIIKDNNGMDVTCEDVLTKAATYRCFKVKIVSNDTGKIFNPSYWPEGIEFRRFRERSENNEPVGNKVSANAAR